MHSFLRTFHPVGQGAFYTEQHLDGHEQLLGMDVVRIATLKYAQHLSASGVANRWNLAG
jgi:hypothetical protein